MANTAEVVIIVFVIIFIIIAVGGIIMYFFYKPEAAKPPAKPDAPKISYVATQGNCSGSQCDGLEWASQGSAPWDAYYQFRCDAGGGSVSDWSKVYGPFSYQNNQYPKVALGPSGSLPCPKGTTMTIQRKKGSSGQWQIIEPHNPDNTAIYYNGNVFWDTNVPYKTTTPSTTAPAS